MKMTNIIRSPRLPKLNLNLLSIVSMIIVCAMVFAPTLVFADDCEEEAQEALMALIGLVIANTDYSNAKKMAKEALRSGDQELIGLAADNLENCRIAKEKAEKRLSTALDDLRECKKNQNGFQSVASGSCGSGSCGSGSCGNG
jgi:hypothetical protein